MTAEYFERTVEYTDNIPRPVHALKCKCSDGGDVFYIYQEMGTNHFHFQCGQCEQPFCPSGCVLPEVLPEVALEHVGEIGY